MKGLNAEDVELVRIRCYVCGRTTAHVVRDRDGHFTLISSYKQFDLGRSQGRLPHNHVTHPYERQQLPDNLPEVAAGESSRIMSARTYCRRADCDTLFQIGWRVLAKKNPGGRAAGVVDR